MGQQSPLRSESARGRTNAIIAHSRYPTIKLGSRHQPKIILRPIKQREQQSRRPILLFARERTEILHHLFEQRAHSESAPRPLLPPFTAA